MANNVVKKVFSKNAVTMYIVIGLYALVSVMLYGGTMGRQMTNMLIPVSCYIVLAVSLNLVVGLLGELSLGHAGFMSVGLFSGCLLSIALANSVPMVVRLPLSMIFGGIFAAVIGFVVGLPALRLNGDYLAIVTLACGEIIKNIIGNLSITGGALGLDTNKGGIYSKPKELLPYAIGLVLITVIVMMNIKKSRHGRAIMAIRDNKIASEATGINVTYYKLVVFMLAAFFAGAAGVLYGHAFAKTYPTTFNYNMSIEILIIVVFGGMGSINGSIIAAIVLRVLSEATREFGEYRMLAYSILLIVIMLLNNNPKFADFKSKITPKNWFSKKNKGGTVNE